MAWAALESTVATRAAVKTTPVLLADGSSAPGLLMLHHENHIYYHLLQFIPAQKPLISRESMICADLSGVRGGGYEEEGILQGIHHPGPRLVEGKAFVTLQASFEDG